MGKREIIIVVSVAIVISAAFLISIIFKSQQLNSIVILCGGAAFLTAGSYFLFDDDKIFLFTLLGFILMFGRYLTVYLFLKPYPEISFFVLIIFVVLGMISFGIAIFKIFKELLEKYGDASRDSP